MSQYKKKYKQMRIINIILTVMLVICLALIVFLLNRGPVPQKDDAIQQPQTTEQLNDTATNDSENVTDTTDSTTVPETVAQQDEDLIGIETPYVELGYPAEWESYLQYERKNENGVFTVSFSGNIAQEQIPLFDIHFGGEDVGELLGYIVANEEKISVSVTPYERMADASWREDDQFVLYAMQEGINMVIQSIMADPTYTSQ